MSSRPPPHLLPLFILHMTKAGMEGYNYVGGASYTNYSSSYRISCTDRSKTANSAQFSMNTMRLGKGVELGDAARPVEEAST